MKQWKSTLDMRATFEQAADHLAMHRKCSPREAQEWLHHEARAKKAPLDKVARAILAGETVGYGHDVPI